MGTVYVPLVCHYNGELKHDTRNPIYVGGHMKADRVSKDISFREFILKMRELCKLPPDGTTIRIKFRYLLDQYTSIAMQVEDDDSLSIIMDLYPHHCYAIVAYIEKHPAQNSTTTTRRCYLPDSLAGSHKEEAMGEVSVRQVVGNTIDTVKQGDVQNHEGMRYTFNASPIHMHETPSSSIVADHLHDMANTPVNAHSLNHLAGGSCNNTESVVIEMSSKASEVPLSLPRYYSGNISTISSSVSERIQRGFAWGSEGVKRIRTSLNFLESTTDSSSQMKVLHPRDQFLQRWNEICLLLCVIAVYTDALFLYIPVIDGKKNCFGFDEKLKITAFILRSFADIYYVLNIFIQFRSAFISPIEGGILNKDPGAIARRCISIYFLIDILSVLPLPQVLFIIIPKWKGSVISNMKFLLWSIVLFQYFPRFLRIYPLYKVVRRTVIITKTAWVGAVFNFSLYMLASHIFGAFWYLLSIEREHTCWRDACRNITGCNGASLYCGDCRTEGGNAFVYASCPIIEPNTTLFDFGIYLDALQLGVVESRDYPRKLFYCFWWGLQNLSSLGQNLKTSTYPGEVSFAVSVSIFGLFLFTLLIGNVQTYLQSNTIKSEKEMRAKLQDVEQWMSHTSLPKYLRRQIRRYEHYRWKNTRGFDVENLLTNLPKDLRREIKNHQRSALVRTVPMFKEMDDYLFDALYDRLKRVFYIEDDYFIREGNPVEEMLFIMRGKLSVTTNGGMTGLVNSDYLKAGDFYGVELLTWALEPHSSNLPMSTRTVQAVTEVDAFALMANDLKLVASQFPQLHSKQFMHIFRFYSQQWRTSAACNIQAAWRHYYKKKLEESSCKEDRLQATLVRGDGNSSRLSATIYDAARALRRRHTNKVVGDSTTNAASEASKA